jgi:hypothetical protein
MLTYSALRLRGGPYRPITLAMALRKRCSSQRASHVPNSTTRHKTRLWTSGHAADSASRRGAWLLPNLALAWPALRVS